MTDNNQNTDDIIHLPADTKVEISDAQAEKVWEDVHADVLAAKGFELGKLVELPGRFDGGKTLFYVNTLAMAAALGDIGGGSLLDAALVNPERELERIYREAVLEGEELAKSQRAQRCRTCNGRREATILVDTDPSKKEVNDPVLGKQMLTLNTPYRKPFPATIGRNEKCLCGSGKKNKHCHNSTGQPSGRWQFQPATCRCQLKNQQLQYPAVA